MGRSTAKTSLILDLDGTIVLTEEYHFEAFQAAFKEHGIDYTFDLHASTYTGTGSSNIFTTEFEKAGMRAAEIAKAFPKADKHKQGLYRRIAKKRGVPTVAGVKDFLAEAKLAGLSLAIATSTGPVNAAFLLKEVKLTDIFDVIVTIADVKNPKPHPEPFLLAANRLGTTPPQAIVFEDSPRGIESAQKAGFATIGLTTTSKKSDLWDKGADLVAKDYTEFTLEAALQITDSNKV